MSAKQSPSRVTGCTSLVRSRSQSAIGICEALRSAGSGYGGAALATRGGGATDRCWTFEDMNSLSMETEGHLRDRPCVWRILVAGLLPLQRLRFSWLLSGSGTVSHVNRVGCFSVQLGHSADRGPKQVTLRRAARISRENTKIFSRGTNCSRRVPNGSATNCGSTFIARGAP
jgi:hypothetical protein